MKERSVVGTVLKAASLGLVAYMGIIGTQRGPYAQAGAATKEPISSDGERPFSLIDSSGATVTDRAYRGNWLIVFFGFTHCGDTCPTALFKLSKALDVLGKQAANVRVAFITIDPERDSPQALKEYLKAFNPQFAGLTGSPEAIRVTERKFRVYADKQAAKANGDYGMSHSATFYVLDPSGQFRRQMSAESSVGDLAASLRSALKGDAESGVTP